METSSQKICARCKQIKPVEAFTIDRRWNKPKSWCKECHRIYVKDRARIWRQQFPLLARIHDQEQRRKFWPRIKAESRRRYLRIKTTAAYKARKAEQKKRIREKNPLAYRAHIAVMHAKKTGKLIPQPCETCGCKERIHAHHDDYSRPLDVRWLCDRHHRMLHGLEKDFQE